MHAYHAFARFGDKVGELTIHIIIEALIIS